MLSMIDLPDLGRALITILVVVDPIGSLPVFYYATSSVPRRLHRAFAIRAVLIATVVLMLFLVGGQYLLEALGLRLGSFQIAGGIVLFLFAMTMVFGEPKSQIEIKEAARDHLANAVFPLAIPSIASPGAMLAIVVLTDNNENTLLDQGLTAVLLLIVMAITLVLLLMAARLKPFLGATGANIISRIMGIILATIAVDAVLGGLETVGVVDLVPAQEGVLDTSPGT
ncbi:MarC family protein [Thalassobaculum sp.]|jgi:multiple antibiotic resistance protein|uniref:MarC family protein n=1 Tax=Thalassobaculum sp. TaxID=2022740 RepID=UPI003B5A56E1